MHGDVKDQKRIAPSTTSVSNTCCILRRQGRLGSIVYQEPRNQRPHKGNPRPHPIALSGTLPSNQFHQQFTPSQYRPSSIIHHSQETMPLRPPATRSLQPRRSNLCQTRPHLAAAGSSSTSLSSTTVAVRHSSSGDSHYDPPSGWLFGVPPGQKAPKEGWENVWVYGFFGSLLFGVVGYAYKPDTS